MYSNNGCIRCGRNNYDIKCCSYCLFYDCLGVAKGDAKLDVCGVCNGDGSSCLE